MLSKITTRRTSMGRQLRSRTLSPRTREIRAGTRARARAKESVMTGMTMTTGGGKVEAKEGCMIMSGMMITMTAEGKGRAEAKTIDTMTTTEAKGKAKIT